MELKFETKMWETAKCNVVTVPKAFIKHGLLDPEKKYEITIRELPDASKKAQDGFYGILSQELVPVAVLED